MNSPLLRVAKKSIEIELEDIEFKLGISKPIKEFYERYSRIEVSLKMLINQIEKVDKEFY